MATRRAGVKDARHLESEKVPAASAPEPSDTSAPVPSRVIYQLLAFTLAMVCAPLGVYFGSVQTIFKGNSTYAGATAAVTANLVLVAYVVVAMREDQGDRSEIEEKRRMKKAE